MKIKIRVAPNPIHLLNYSLNLSVFSQKIKYHPLDKFLISRSTSLSPLQSSNNIYFHQGIPMAKLCTLSCISFAHSMKYSHSMKYTHIDEHHCQQFVRGDLNSIKFQLQCSLSLKVLRRY